MPPLGRTSRVVAKKNSERIKNVVERWIFGRVKKGSSTAPVLIHFVPIGPKKEVHTNRRPSRVSNWPSFVGLQTEPQNGRPNQFLSCPQTGPVMKKPPLK
eukprot:GEMP01071230.1.p2 GENE.GEMP01071230.1~~GEMP01071230.1.p2  ORF type:complete len:100 (+),score=0.26 GEMP01071230.1:680-979(+)